jgi:hypothetical protein
MKRKRRKRKPPSNILEASYTWRAKRLIQYRTDLPPVSSGRVWREWTPEGWREIE